MKVIVTICLPIPILSREPKIHFDRLRKGYSCTIRL